MMKIEQFEAELTDLTPTEHNPRQINQKDFEKLKKSLKEFPEMKEIREVVIDENNRILGGHMRVKALKELGEKTVYVKQVFGLTEEQKNEFVIKDNIANGEWDMDELANSWSDLPLDEWGLEIIDNEDDYDEDKADKDRVYREAEIVLAGVSLLGASSDQILVRKLNEDETKILTDKVNAMGSEQFIEVLMEKINDL